MYSKCEMQSISQSVAYNHSHTLRTIPLFRFQGARVTREGYL